MRMRMGVLAGLLATGLIGCSGANAGIPAPGSAPVAPTSSTPAAPTKSGLATAPAGPVEPKTRAGARAAGARFYALSTASNYAASWELLAPTAKREIPKTVWVRVHSGCSPTHTGSTANIKSVTVFGDAAIITWTIADAHSRHHTGRNVFNYVHGHWGYSPTDSSIYHHGSIAADIAAARAAGLCTSQKASLL